MVRILLTLYLSLFCATLYAESMEKKPLVINSNGGVEKYRAAQTSFMEAFGSEAAVIDLGESRWNPKRLKQRLYDDYPDIIYAIGAKAYLAASEYIGEKTIVFSSIVNYRRIAMEPGHFGISEELHSGMQMTLIRHAFPHVKRVALFYTERYTKEWYHALKKSAQQTGIELVGHAVNGVDDTKSAMDAALDGADAFVMLSDPVLLSDTRQVQQLIDRCNERKIPVIGFLDSLAEMGASLVLSTDTPTTGRQAASMITSIRRGQPPAVRVQSPAGSKLIVNLRQIEELQVPYDDDVLQNANRVIQ